MPAADGETIAEEAGPVKDAWRHRVIAVPRLDMARNDSASEEPTDTALGPPKGEGNPETPILACSRGCTTRDPSNHSLIFTIFPYAVTA